MGRPALYRELTGLICESIVSGDIADGITVSEICERFGASRRTVLRSLSLLRDCGVMDMGAGRKLRFAKPTDKSRSTSGNSGKTDTTASRRLAELIRSRIEEGAYLRGTALPKSLSFCVSNHISSHTVGRAMLLLEKEKLIRKEGKRWMVGSPLPQPGTTYKPAVVCVIQQTPNALGELFSDPIWSRFAGVFSDEALRHGVQMQPVILDSTVSFSGAVTGRRAFVRHLHRLGDRCIGTLVLPPRERMYASQVVEWINLAAEHTRRVVWSATNLEWTSIKQKVSRHDNVRLALFGDWPFEGRPGKVGLALETLVGAGHRSILYVDTFGVRERWMTDRIMHLRNYMETLELDIDLKISISSAPFLEKADQTEIAAIATFLADRKIGFAEKLLRSMSTDGGGIERLSEVEREIMQDAGILMPLLGETGITAIIAPNDMRARRYYNFFSAVGIEIPDDLSMISFDDAPFLKPFPISSIDFGMANLGHKALHVLLGDIPVKAVGGVLTAVPGINHYGSIALPRRNDSLFPRLKPRGKTAPAGEAQSLHTVGKEVDMHTYERSSDLLKEITQLREKQKRQYQRGVEHSTDSRVNALLQYLCDREERYVEGLSRAVEYEGTLFDDAWQQYIPRTEDLSLPPGDNQLVENDFDLVARVAQEFDNRLIDFYRTMQEEGGTREIRSVFEALAQQAEREKAKLEQSIDELKHL